MTRTRTRNYMTKRRLLRLAPLWAIPSTPTWARQGRSCQGSLRGSACGSSSDNSSTNSPTIPSNPPSSSGNSAGSTSSGSSSSSTVDHSTPATDQASTNNAEQAAPAKNTAASSAPAQATTGPEDHRPPDDESKPSCGRLFRARDSEAYKWLTGEGHRRTYDREGVMKIFDDPEGPARGMDLLTIAEKKLDDDCPKSVESGSKKLQTQWPDRASTLLRFLRNNAPENVKAKADWKNIFEHSERLESQMAEARRQGEEARRQAEEARKRKADAHQQAEVEMPNVEPDADGSHLKCGDVIQTQRNCRAQQLTWDISEKFKEGTDPATSCCRYQGG
ncbi:unnamed protein product [Amoebophrya sp. A25]|nr:unnamed protein product [Amoebophrya sp. A25]|eukprot:GSA25T00003000001.1